MSVKYRNIMGLFFLTILFIFFVFSVSSGQGVSNRQTRLLFVIDFDDFMCYSCLDSFLNLYKSLPLPYQEEMSFGIVLVDKKENNRKKTLSQAILEKKLRGFVKSNQIKLPLIIDQLHNFDSLAEEGTTVYLFCPEDKIVKKYTFPLSAKKMGELFTFLN